MLCIPIEYILFYIFILPNLYILIRGLKFGVLHHQRLLSFVSNLLYMASNTTLATRLFEPIEAWTGENTALESWLERLECKMMLGSVTEDKMRVATLISHIGSVGYETLKSLCSPDKPMTKTYDELAKLLTDFCSPKPVVTVERFKFNQLKQEQESVAEFLG